LFTADRLEWGAEKVKMFFRFFSIVSEKRGFAEENEGIDSVKIGRLDSVKIGKRAIAMGYLGLQGTGDESGTMDESKEPLSSGEDMESDCKRNGAEPSDSIV
jgi:hypothetical protein